MNALAVVSTVGISVAGSAASGIGRGLGAVAKTGGKGLASVGRGIEGGRFSTGPSVFASLKTVAQPIFGAGNPALDASIQSRPTFFTPEKAVSQPIRNFWAESRPLVRSDIGNYPEISFRDVGRFRPFKRERGTNVENKTQRVGISLPQKPAASNINIWEPGLRVIQVTEAISRRVLTVANASRTIPAEIEDPRIREQRAINNLRKIKYWTEVIRTAQTKPNEQTLAQPKVEGKVAPRAKALEKVQTKTAPKTETAKTSVIKTVLKEVLGKLKLEKRAKSIVKKYFRDEEANQKRVEEANKALASLANQAGEGVDLKNIQLPKEHAAIRSDLLRNVDIKYQPDGSYKRAKTIIESGKKFDSLNDAAEWIARVYEENTAVAVEKNGADASVKEVQRVIEYEEVWVRSAASLRQVVEARVGKKLVTANEAKYELAEGSSVEEGDSKERKSVAPVSEKETLKDLLSLPVHDLLKSQTQLLEALGAPRLTQRER